MERSNKYKLSLEGEGGYIRWCKKFLWLPILLILACGTSDMICESADVGVKIDGTAKLIPVNPENCSFQPLTVYDTRLILGRYECTVAGFEDCYIDVGNIHAGFAYITAYDGETVHQMWVTMQNLNLTLMENIPEKFVYKATQPIIIVYPR